MRSLVLIEPPVFPLPENNHEGCSLRNEFLSAIWGPTGKFMQQKRTGKGVKAIVDGMVSDGAYDQVFLKNIVH